MIMRTQGDNFISDTIIDCNSWMKKMLTAHSNIRKSEKIGKKRQNRIFTNKIPTNISYEANSSRPHY